MLKDSWQQILEPFSQVKWRKNGSNPMLSRTQILALAMGKEIYNFDIVLLENFSKNKQKTELGNFHSKFPARLAKFKQTIY